MNELSWIIYLADVAGSAKFMGILAIVFCIIVMLAAWLSRAFNRDMMKIFPPDGEGFSEHRSKANASEKAFKPAIISIFWAAVVVVFVPSSGTLYAVAASEMGEKVLKSETGGKAVEALNAWLDRQIAGPRG